MKLTPAEKAVLLAICEGKTDKVIARIMGKSAITVRHQVHDIRLKLGANTRAHAVAIYLAPERFRPADDLDLKDRR